MPVHASGSHPVGKFTCDTVPAAPAVVPIVTVTACPLVPEICTEEGTLHVSAGLTTGVMLQLRLTVPANDPEGISIKLNFALCPALTVCEVGAPEAAPSVKSAGEAACTTSDAVALFTTPPEVP